MADTEVTLAQALAVGGWYWFVGRVHVSAIPNTLIKEMIHIPTPENNPHRVIPLWGEWLHADQFEGGRLWGPVTPPAVFTATTVVPVATAPGAVQTCPRRREGGPWDSVEQQDRWELVGVDRVCSFCGSLHPAAMERVCAAALDPQDPTRVTQSVIAHKIYVSRPQLRKGELGSTKYYRQHDYTDPPDRQRLTDLLTRALAQSRTKAFLTIRSNR